MDHYNPKRNRREHKAKGNTKDTGRRMKPKERLSLATGILGFIFIAIPLLIGFWKLLNMLWRPLPYFIIVGVVLLLITAFIEAN